VYKQAQWPLTLYFDGDCPLCAREIKLLRARAAPDQLLLVDISAPAFDAQSLGFTREQMEASLHARFDDGTWVTGLDATLWSWRAAGLGRWAAPLEWRPLRPLLTLGYRLFCRWRPHLAWLPHPDGSRRCREDSCAIADTKTAPVSQTPPTKKMN
jgi:predicted DCC family thiol-disulfide oxidoreductase YuxK